MNGSLSIDSRSDRSLSGGKANTTREGSLWRIWVLQFCGTTTRDCRFSHLVPPSLKSLPLTGVRSIGRLGINTP